MKSDHPTISRYGLIGGGVALASAGVICAGALGSHAGPQEAGAVQGPNVQAFDRSLEPRRLPGSRTLTPPRTHVRKPVANDLLTPESMAAFLADTERAAGLEDALLLCPPPELVPKAGEEFSLATVNIDLYFGPEGLVDAVLLDVDGGRASEEAMACYSETLWAVDWPAFPSDVLYEGSWRLAGESVMSPEEYAAIRSRAIADGRDPDAEEPFSFRIVGPDGRPQGPPIRLVPPR